MKPLFFIGLLLFVTLPLSNAQHNEIEDHEEIKHEKGHDEIGKHHRISALMAFSNIPTIVPGKKERKEIFIPTVGLNYDFWFHPKWGAGLHNDIILQHYEVEEHHGEQQIVRSFPVAVKAVVLYEPIHSLVFLTGYGFEIEPSETLQVITAGIEYGIEIRNNWEVNFNLVGDYQINKYFTWFFGIGFSKMFYTKQ